MELVLNVELHSYDSVPALMRAMRQGKMGSPVSYDGNLLVGYEGAEPCMWWQFRRQLGPATVAEILDDLTSHLSPWRDAATIEIVDGRTGFRVDVVP